MTAHDIAQICHEANRFYCRSIGDNSQPSWEDAPGWQRISAINGVNFHLNNPGATEDASHNCWWDEKKANGWIYGPEKNPDKREHPCCVPFDQLPPEQQAKDRLFKFIVDALRACVDPVKPLGGVE